MVGTELAQRLWTDAQTNVHLRVRLRASYRGRHDVLDALWWRAHPSTRSPGGEPDPSTALPELMAEVYSRRGMSEPLIEFLDPVSDRMVRATASGQALRALTIDLTHDAAALDAVLEQFGQPNEHDGAGQTRRTRQTEQTGQDRPRDRSGRRTAAKSTLAGVAGALALTLTAFLALTGWNSGSLFPDLGPGVPGPAGSGSSGADATSAVRDDPFQIFDTPAQYTTGVTHLLGPEFLPLTLRRIPNAAAAVTGLHMFAVQRTDGTYCLILQQPKDETDEACATREAIQQRGLRLQAIVVPEDPGSTYPQPFDPVNASIEWDRHGVFTAHFEPRFP